MSANWPIRPLCDLLELVIDHRGKTPKKMGFEDFHSRGYPVLSAKHVKTDHLVNHEAIRFSNDEMYKKWMKIEIQEGDIVLTSEAPLGHVYYLDGKTKYLLGQRVFGLRPNKEKVNPLYLAAWLASRKGQSLLEARSTGSTVLGIKQAELLKVEVDIPPEEVQEVIARNRYDLVKKIDLNTQTNQTLEAIAQALFKSWFVDFDPVKAKISAKQQWLQNNHSPLEGESKSASIARRDSVGGIKRRYTPTALNHSKLLRQSQTDAEGLLWYYLRNKQMAGFKFRRQQAIGHYIVDFVCLQKKLVLELDGGHHAQQQSHDKKRDIFLQAQGFTVLRFWNNEVFERCFDVLEKIYCQLVPTPYPQEANAFASAPSPNQTAPSGLSSSTLPQGEGDLEETMNLAAMRVIASKSLDELAELKQSKPDAYDQLAQTAALFPSAMQESELGEIPEGWGTPVIQDVATVIKGKSYKSSELSPSSTALVTLKSFNRGGGYRLDGLKEYTGKYKPEQEVFAGDLIIAYTDVTQAADVIGKPAMVISDARYKHLVISLDVAVVRPSNDNLKYYLYGVTNTGEFQQHTQAHSTGTTVLHLNKNTVPNYRFALANKELVNAYIEHAKPVFSKINETIEENNPLSTLRDTLLPKLLSGSLEIV